MSRFCSPALLLLLAALAPSASAQRDAKVPDPDPELERKTFVVPEGFEVSLFAADPMLAKPIQMNFDPQGRLWVASSEVYPQIKPGAKANDRVLILEDRNSDGKADKTTVFADGLLIPTGVAPGDGGVYVANSTELVHFSDPDPTTGKARKKRIVLSGFGTEDTHHILHTLRWGPDGSLYMSQSIYIHSNIETPRGVKRLNAGGIWRFRPETLELSDIARGFVNTWGTVFDRWGQTFATDGAYGEGINILMPGAYYVTNGYGVARILKGLNPGSPKHCGLTVLSGRHLPEAYQGSLITNDFRGHRVCRFVLKDDGSGYRSQEQQELIKSTHPAFRPIDVAMGPDGAIYVADWYNPIIQHGEVDFRDPRRDHTHGRIWRITAKNRPLVERPKLADATIPQLLDQLKAPEDWTRQMARQVLRERDRKEVAAALDAWLKQLDRKDPAFAHHQLEALWTYQTIDTVNASLLETVLNSPDPRARAAACRVLAAWSNRLPNPLELLAARVIDENPRVRLDAVRALGTIPKLEAATLAAKALDHPMDPWLDYGLWLAFRELAPHWLPAVQAGRFDFHGNPSHLIFALQAVEEKNVGQLLWKLYEDHKIPSGNVTDVLKTVVRLGTAKEAAHVAVLGSGSDQATLGDQLLPVVVEEVRRRKLPAIPEMLAGLSWDQLLRTPGTPRYQAALRLIGLWKQENHRDRLMEVVNRGTATLEDRLAAIDGLISLGGDKSLAFLMKKAADAADPTVQRLAVTALTSLDLPAAANQAVKLLASAKPSPELADVFTAFLNRKNGARVLTKALANAKLAPDVAKLGVRAAKATGQADPALVAALTKAGNLTDSRLSLAGKELEQFLAEVATKGDPARGEQIYRRAELNCLKCHAVAGAGGKVGPDLSSIGASAPPDYLIDSLLKPNSKIKEGFNTFIVTTVDDRVFIGIRVRESATELVLRDSEDKQITIPIADIDARKDGQSLMPEGLVDQLTRQELVDLTRFLSELGKGAYLATPGKVVRSWEALQPTKEMHYLLNRQRLGAVAAPENSLQWAPAYGLVSGDLPLDALPRFKAGQTSGTTSVVRFHVPVSTVGRLHLELNDTAGLTLWLDGVAVEVTKSMSLEVKPGVRTITVAIDPTKRKVPLRVALNP